MLLFIVEGAIKRYMYYKGHTYPEGLFDLIPKYLSLRENERLYLAKLSYQRDPHKGYRLSLAKVSAGERNVIFSPKGIESTHPLGWEPK